MPTIINGTTGVDQVTDNTLVVADAKSGQAVGFQKMQLFAAKEPANGTFVDFSPADGTGIPSWAKKITVSLSWISGNGTSPRLLQIGTASGLETASYFGGVFSSGMGSGNSNFTTGFTLEATTAAASMIHGSVVLTKVSDNLWVESGIISKSDNTLVSGSSGSKLLLGALDRVRLTTVNGTDTFDAGSISILVEGYE